MATRMKQRRGTHAQWISTNAGQGPILEPGEIGFESDTNKFKIGDGSNHWINLPYFLNEDDVSGLPSQAGNQGKYLTTNGSIASWASVQEARPHPFAMIG